MGTNYHARINQCGTCDRYDELHIGKSMRTVRAHPDRGIHEFADWRKLLDSPAVSIWDEYGSQLNLDSSVEVNAWLDEWQRWDSRTAWHLGDRYAGTYEAHGDYLDSDGYHVCAREFS